MPTTNLGITLPTEGGSEDTWGGLLNAGIEAIDAIFAPDGTAVSLNIGANKSLNLGGGNLSAAWTTSGVKIKMAPATYTDTTSSAGTVPDSRINQFGAPTFAASNAITITDAFHTYFSDPVAGSNVSFTNKWALGADSLRVSGISRFGGAMSNVGTTTTVADSTAAFTMVNSGNSKQWVIYPVSTSLVIREVGVGDVLSCNAGGTVTVHSLAGSGDRAVIASSTGLLSAP